MPSTKELSQAQAHANFVVLEGDNVTEALDEMQDSTSYEQLSEDFEWNTEEKNVVVTRLHYKDHQSRDVIEYMTEPQDGKPSHSIMVFDMNDAIASTSPWVVDYRQKTSTHKASLTAFYFTDKFGPLDTSSATSNTTTTTAPTLPTVVVTSAASDSSAKLFYNKLMLMNAQIDQSRANNQEWLALAAKQQEISRKNRRWLTFLTVCRSIPLMQIVLAVITK